MTQFKFVGAGVIIVLGLRTLIFLIVYLYYHKLSWSEKIIEFKKTIPGKIFYNKIFGGVVAFCTVIIPIVIMGQLSERDLKLFRRSTIGVVSYSGCGGKTGCSVSVDFSVEGKTYYATTSLLDQEVSAISKGQLFIVEYSYKNPDYAHIVLDKPIISKIDSLLCRLATVLELKRGDEFLSIFYRFYYGTTPYYGVRFAPLNTKIKVGEEYNVEFPRSNPEVGVFNLNQKLDIEKLIESAKRLNTDSLPTGVVRDTIIDGKRVQIID